MAIRGMEPDKNKKGDMKKSTLLHKQLRFKKVHRAKFFKTIHHSFDRKNNVNCIESKSHLNSYFLKGKEANCESVLRYFHNEHFKPVKSPSLAKHRSVLKSKLKRWLESDKTTVTEKKLFQMIISRIENGLLYNNSAEYLNNIDEKVSRFNDKFKALKELEEVHRAIVDSPPLASGFEIEVVELLFKIPDAQTAYLEPQIQYEL